MLRLLFVLLMWSPVSRAMNPLVLTVPFQNINVNPQQALIANYEFDKHVLMLCLSNGVQNTDVIAWNYKRTYQTSILPVLLKTNSIYDGFFINPTGVITIQNTQTLSQQFSCVYAY